MTDKTKIPEHHRVRYMELMHAMQSGVRQLMVIDSGSPASVDRAEAGPKHLRVGVNSTLIQSSAVALLLMEKGIIAPDEYFGKVNELLAADVASYERKLSDKMGVKVTLA